MEHFCKLRVRFIECDMYGHVNNAKYLSYLEHARVELLRDLNIPIEKLSESGYYLYIAKICIEYKKPAKMNDNLTVRTRLISKKRTSGVFNQTILNGEDLIADAEVKWVCSDKNGKPVKLPAEISMLDVYK
jgi:acyl-CoA thioester hydrolase